MRVVRNKPAICLSVFGTGSDVGKSIVVAALCRIFSDLGIRVAPFKAQNMSNNSFVTPEGGEMGRAQVVQAEAARARLHVDMNPVLLKPCSDTGAQVVVHGRPVGNQEAAAYFGSTRHLFRAARASLNRLRAAYELVVIEGAGSCAEINLRSRDFVNFRTAHATDSPVILVADIDRGGVFAQIVGTLDVVPRRDRERVRGLIINKFRGDPELFRDGISYIKRRTGLPVLGLIPYYRHIEIDAEDGMPLDALIDPKETPERDKINIAVLRVPHISNFTDFAPLMREVSVRLHYLARPRALHAYDCVLLPGSKNVRADLDWIRAVGWDRHLDEYRALGGQIGGICGGYQMLGQAICDPSGLEGPPGTTMALGFLDVMTTLRPEKILARVSGIWLPTGHPVAGYEIHMGVTERAPGTAAAVRIAASQGPCVDVLDGAISAERLVWGTYLHGLFDLPGFRTDFLSAFQTSCRAEPCGLSIPSEHEFRNRQYDLLADHFRRHLYLEELFRIAGLDIPAARAG